MAAQAVERRDRRLRVRHPDVDVQRARRIALEQAAHRLVDLLVARLAHVHDLAEAGGRVQAGSRERRAGREYRLAQAPELGGGVRRRRAHRRRALDHRLVDVGLDVRRSDPRDQLAGVMVEVVRRRALDEQQLFLHPDRPGRGPETVLHEGESSTGTAGRRRPVLASGHDGGRPDPDRGAAPACAGDRRGHAQLGREGAVLRRREARDPAARRVRRARRAGGALRAAVGGDGGRRADDGRRRARRARRWPAVPR